MNIEPITLQDAEKAYDIVKDNGNPSQGDKTYTKELYRFDDGKALFFCAGTLYDGDSFDHYCRLGIENPNAVLADFEFDYAMPWDPNNEYGDVVDTEISLPITQSDVDWLNKEANDIVKGYESGELVASSRKAGEKKPVKSSEDKEKYWGAFGENGCVDFLTREEFIEKFGEEPKDEDALDYVDSGCHGKDEKDKKKKPVQSMARGYLQPQYDSRASFYNKAEFDDDKLYSYGTLVAEIVDGKPVLYPDWDYSQTTIRHVREFLRQHGFTADSKAQIAKDYLTNARKAVKSSMSVEELPREALQELKQRYYAEKYDKDLSYGELADIDDIVSDEEVFDEYGDTDFTEDDFFCLAQSRKPVESSIQGQERGIQAIMDEYGCTREEAIEIMNEEIQNSRKPIKSSLVNGISDEELKLLCRYADMAFDDIDFFYDNDPDTLAEHDYDQSELHNAQKIAQRLYNMLSEGI